jgi:hypothetical protein
MSNAAVLARPTDTAAESEWIELDDIDYAVADLGIAVSSDTDFVELDTPVTTFASQDDMRFGPRSYTRQQAEVIQLATRQRKPLPAPPLPLDE